MKIRNVCAPRCPKEHSLGDGIERFNFEVVQSIILESYVVLWCLVQSMLFWLSVMQYEDEKLQPKATSEELNSSCSVDEYCHKRCSTSSLE